MSHPPEYPGKQRLERAASRTGSSAYQGAFEAVGAIVVAIGIGYWVDVTWETSPIGVLVGAVIGFAAFVLRLVRLGRHLQAESDAALPGPEIDDEDLGTGEAPGLSSVLHDEDDVVGTDPTDEKK